MARTDELRRLITSRGEAIFDRAIQEMKDALKEAAPTGESGDTREQVDVRSAGRGSVFAAEAVAPAKGGEFVEEGTSAHIIVPRGGGVLVFESGGQTVFARHVNHPGTQAKPWFRPTVERWQRVLQDAARVVG